MSGGATAYDRAMGRLELRRLAREIADLTPYSRAIVRAALYDLAESDIEGDPLVFFQRCSLNGLSPTRVAAYARLEAVARHALEEAAARRAAIARKRRRIGIAWHTAWGTFAFALSAYFLVSIATTGRPIAVVGVAFWSWVLWDHASKLREIRRDARAA